MTARGLRYVFGHGDIPPRPPIDPDPPPEDDPQYDLEVQFTVISANKHNISVLVTSAETGLPVSGVSVLVTAHTGAFGNGTTENTDVTNASGLTQTRAWIFDPVVGGTVTYEEVGAEGAVSYVVEGTGDPNPSPDYTITAITTGPYSGDVGSTVQIVVEVTDENDSGNVAPNVLVSVASGFPTPSGSAFAGTTNASGRVTINWTLGNTATTYSLRVTAPDGSLLNLNATANAVTPPDPPEEGVITAKVFRWDGNVGASTVFGTLTLPPGRMLPTQTNQIRVFVQGVEKAIAVNPLFGKFQDGTLRSVGIEFNHTFASTAELNAEIHIDTAGRGTTDIAWVEPTYFGLVAQRANIVITDPEWLCATFAALVPLQPEADDDATVAGRFGTALTQEAGEWSAAIEPQQQGYPTSGSTYEYVHGDCCMWLRSGKIIHWKRFYNRLYDQMKGTAGSENYFLPGANSQAYVQVTVPEGLDVGAVFDPANTTNRSGWIGGDVPINNSGQGNEHNTGTGMGWTTGYLVTGWKQPWRFIAYKSNSTQSNTSTYAAALEEWMSSGTGGSANLRSNVQRRAIWPILGYIIEATMPVPSPSGAPRSPSRLWATELPRIIDAFWERRYQDYTDTVLGRVYIDDLSGQGQQARSCGHPDTLTPPGPYAGHIPNFQGFIFTRCLHLYYNHLPVDDISPVSGLSYGTMILTMLEAWATHLIAQGIQNPTDATWRMDYEMADAPSVNHSRYNWAFYPELFGFLWAATGNATYQTWAQRATHRSQLNGHGFTRKGYGEWFAGHLQCVGYYLSGGAARGVAGAHRTVINEPPAHSNQ